MSDLVFIGAALATVLIGTIGAWQYWEKHGVPGVRRLSAISYTVAFMSIFFSWMSVHICDRILGFCVVDTSATDNLYQITQGVDPTLQRELGASTNSAIPTIQSVVSKLVTESDIILACLVIGLIVMIIGMLPQSSSGNKITAQSIMLAIIGALTSLIGVICCFAMFGDLNNLISNFTDSSLSWSTGIGGYIAIIALGLGAITWLIKPSSVATA